MLGPYPYAAIPHRTHLSENELAIWRRFLFKYPDRFDEVWYDVELGTPRGFDPERPEPYQSHHRYLGGYKIDVLGRKDVEHTIVEIKRGATTKALGEIWLYEYLYKALKNPEAVVKLLIVTDEEMPHMREVCESDGVELVVV